MRPHREVADATELLAEHLVRADLVGVNHWYVTRPGTRSIFTRNCGTAKSCSTSVERSSTCGLIQSK
jgi:hypothetical protein